MELSISRIKAFKACRRMYQLKYVERIEPVKTPEALEIGRNYHKMIDAFYKGEEVPEMFTKEAAMFAAYKKYIASKFNVVGSEQRLEKELPGRDVKFVGIADGIAEDGHLVEHKTTGSDVGELYEYNLQWDEQLLAYMWMTGRRKMWYTVCKKPTIRQKKDESDEDFYRRMVAWYDDETETKIGVIEVERTDEEIEQFKQELYEMCVEIAGVNLYGPFYRNTCHCQAWGGRCEYQAICLNYDPKQEYIGFTKREGKR